jgi:hypothetical protein
VLLPNSAEVADPKAGVGNPVVVFFPKVCPNGLAAAPVLKPPPPKQTKTFQNTVLRKIRDALLINCGLEEIT